MRLPWVFIWESFMIVLSGITIQNKIYESSASLVYRGLREEDSQAIVIKLLKQDYPSLQELTRYRQEYAITRFLNIEGVIRAYNQQDYQRTLVILLEDFFGESLEYWIQQRPEAFCPMPVSNFFPLAINLSKILGRIHAANVIHKDINPGNIVLNPNTRVVKIIDFGISTQLTRTNPTFKNPNILEGTLAYMSPEQTGRMNRTLDYRTDFYSLGVTFYEMLCGELPFNAIDPMELVHCHIAKNPVSPCNKRDRKIEGRINQAEIGEIPQVVCDLVMKLLAKTAEDRYQSAFGLACDLENCLAQLQTTGEISHITLGEQDQSSHLQISQKLYGREAEVNLLLSTFDRIRRGNTEIVLISGCAGLGKSCLAYELFKPIVQENGYFIDSKFDQFKRDIPYGFFLQAFQELLRQILTETATQLQVWREKILNALGGNCQVIIEVIPEVDR